jgi:hypothetical protein
MLPKTWELANGKWLYVANSLDTFADFITTQFRVVACEDGHPIGECFVRKEPPTRTKTEDETAMDTGAMGMQGNYFAGRKSSRVV